MAGGAAAIVVGVQSYFIVSPSSSVTAVTAGDVTLDSISVSVVGCAPLTFHPQTSTCSKTSINKTAGKQLDLCHASAATPFST